MTIFVTLYIIHYTITDTQTMLNDSQVKKDLYKSLKELGLSEHEITLYSVSVSAGPTPVSKLAEYMNISRPNVYKLIDGLEKAGLAKFSQHKGYLKTFMVEPPSAILERLRAKQEQLKDLDRNISVLMPVLLSEYHQGELPSSIKIYQGQEQFLKIFNQLAEETKDITEFFGPLDYFLSFVTRERDQLWMRERINRNVFCRVISPPSKDLEDYMSRDKEEMRETRVLKAKLPFVTAFQLFSNKVIIWQPKAPLAILISDEYIAAMMRTIFYTIWESTK